MFRFLSGLFARDMGIDLGTANVVVYQKGKGIVADEPSVIAYRKSPNTKDEIIAIGRRAKDMIGKTPQSIITLRPLRHGVIANFDVTEAMLQFYIRMVNGERRLFAHPRVIVSVPACVTEVERKAVIDACLGGGAREAYIIEEPLAAALGAGLPIHEPKGSMVMNIGGGATEVAVLSLGGIVESSSLRVAGDDIDEAIVELLRQNFKMCIGEATAEEIKISVGSACPLDEELSIEVKGRDLSNGLPKTLVVTSSDVRIALEPLIRRMEETVRETLERTSPELVRDIVERGIILTGGGAMLKGLSKRLSLSLNIPVMCAEQPLYAVALGIGKVLDELEKMKRVLISI
ncbi:MAG TPA: rod shape-determining protein [Acetomicrobium sp.]|uniref:rod shape-determining protein n=1 Tax=Acetomicrobium sp. TaxID=1872099 RepID=UPI002B25829A|nr:rod shape-determining protein [Acetomicrobium sp.]HPT64558.1 rod shape-determining protein [Acetomicrobium sp.]HXK98816.1 rod shape-determining protein [Acetomicrobium sp.]